MVPLAFSVEVLIYAYIFICLSMILFNVACIYLFRRRDKRQNTLCGQYETMLCGWLADGMPQGAALARLCRRLAGAQHLAAFEEALAWLVREHPQGATRLLADSLPLWEGLMARCLRGEEMKAAYLAFVLAKYRVCAGRPCGALQEGLFALLGRKNLYCRENALRALYASGDADAVARGLRALSRTGLFHHNKLVTDGLLTFTGSHGALAQLLWAQMGELNVELQVAVLNYLRLSTGSYGPQMLALLQDEARDDEVRYCAIRYLGRYADTAPQGAAGALRALLADPDPLRWNYAAIAAAALARYPGPATVAVLKQALHSANWYVRFNASQSLNDLQVPYLELVDILNGSDRYAREMMLYRLEERRAPSKEVKPT